MYTIRNYKSRKLKIRIHYPISALSCSINFCEQPLACLLSRRGSIKLISKGYFLVTIPHDSDVDMTYILTDKIIL